MSRTTVIVNGGAGGGHDDTLRAQVQGHFEAAGVAAAVILAKGGEAIAAQVDIALRAGVDVIVAGGGDGTVSAVADGNTQDIPKFCTKYEKQIRAAGGIDLQVLQIG